MSTATATKPKSFVQRAESKKNKAVSQEAKQAEKGKVTETKKAETKSPVKKNKVREGIEYTRVVETTPLEKFKNISDATSTLVSGRRPGFKAWGQLGIKIGQEIFYKNHPEIKAVVESEVTNQIKVSIPEEDDFVTFGVIPAERHVRSYLESTKSNPQGFDMWGFHLEEDGSIKWRSVQDLYCAVFPKA